MKITEGGPEGQHFFKVSNEREWAEFSIRTKRTPHSHNREGENLSISVGIHSSFGSWSHYWSHCGDRHSWAAWLENTDFDYAMGKFAGNNTQEFDAEATIKGARQDVINARRQSDLDRYEARDIWNDLDCLDDGGSAEYLIGELADIDLFRDNYYEMARYRTRPDLKRFWDVLWRPWIEEMFRRYPEPVKTLKARLTGLLEALLLC